MGQFFLQIKILYRCRKMNSIDCDSDTDPEETTEALLCPVTPHSLCGFPGGLNGFLSGFRLLKPGPASAGSRRKIVKISQYIA